jgi:UDP-N-acetyl-D-mannosaminuronate dehydrogenase
MGLKLVELTADELRSADAVVLTTDHDDLDYELIEHHASYVFDTRRRLDPKSGVEHL